MRKEAGCQEAAVVSATAGICLQSFGQGFTLKRELGENPAHSRLLDARACAEL